MASIRDLMQQLIEVYALYNPIDQIYKDKTPINNEMRIMLFAQFKILINNYLIQNDKNKIMEHYYELSGALKIEPDKRASPELIWLENVLSQGTNEGICLQILTDCYQRQINPELFIRIRFEDIATLDDLRKWLKQLKQASEKNSSSRRLYENLLTLLEQSEEYLDDVGQLKPQGIALLVSSFPGLLLGLGAVVAAQELMAIYALFFILLKSGKLATQASRKELKVIGGLMQNAGVLSATATTTLLVYLMRLIVWTTHQSYTQTSYASSAVLGVFRNKNTSLMFTEEMLEEELRNAIANDKNKGSGIANLQLRFIAAPIEARLGQIEEQAFINFRLGRKKRESMIYFLQLLKEWDRSPNSMNIKLEKISETLSNLLENNAEVNEGMTAITIKRTRSFLDYFIKNPNFITNMHLLIVKEQSSSGQMTRSI